MISKLSGSRQVSPHRTLRSRLPVVVTVFSVALLLIVVGDCGLAAEMDPLDYRTRRYDRVIGQTDWYTCGPAAIATLLRYYFDFDTSEAEMLGLALEASADQERALTQGLNAAALKHAVEAKGIPVQGYSLTLDNLVDYFARGGLPVVLHVTKPRNHYVVAIGTADSRVVLADPSWGRRIMEISALQTEKHFSGVVLVPLPPDELAMSAKQHQRIVLEEVANQLARLTNLRMRLQ